jgi:hypothetical protein
MLARINGMQIGRSGLRLAAILAGSQLTVAAAKVGSGTTLPGDCGAESAFQIAMTVGQTAWSVVDACVVGRMVHAAGALVASDSFFNPVQAVAGIIGHELSAQLVSIVFQIFS